MMEGDAAYSLSEAQREGLFLTLRYIVITFDFLGINLVISAASLLFDIGPH